MLGPGPERIPRLGPEATMGQRHGLPLDQPMIEPSRALSRDLIGQAEIGPRRQHQSGPRFVRSTEASDLDNAADRRERTWWARPSMPSITA